MFLISLGGTTYGMAEETIAFYALVTSTMVAAGFDSLTAASTILLGSTAGVLGSTVNPFSISASPDFTLKVPCFTSIPPSALIKIKTTRWNCLVSVILAREIFCMNAR